MTEGTLVSSSRLPEHWTWAKLGELASFLNGDRGKNYPSQSDRVDFGVPFINTGHIEPTGRLSRERMDYITRERFEKLGAGKIRPGDIVYCLRGSTIGKTARNEFPEGAIASSLVIIRARDSRLQQFIYFYLASPIGQSLAKKFDNGSAQPNLSAKVISKYPIPLPPEDELVPICQLLTALDDKIDLNRRTNETLEAMARAIFKDWFVDFGPTRAKAKGCAPYLAPELWDLFPDALDDEGKPMGWYQSSLGNELSVLETGKRPRGGVAGISEGIPSVGAESIVKVGEFVFSKTKYVPYDFFSKMSKGHVSDGDVLVYKDGGKPGELRPAVTYVSKGFPFAEFCVNEHVFRIRTKSLSQPILYCLLSTDNAFWQMKELATGVAQPGLNRTAIKSITFTMPDDHRLLRGAEAVIGPMIDRCNDNSLNSLVLSKVRNLLLPKLMSGQIRLCDAEKVVEGVA